MSQLKDTWITPKTLTPGAEHAALIFFSMFFIAVEHCLSASKKAFFL
jgi:cbb3-type cytochrome oxidase subunit 3